MFNNIKMKLLIGGKNRNIYMRKDGSAYYKSRGENVDITHMFKKNGGGLKKKYIKGGTTEAKFIDLKDKCNKLHEKLKALHDELKSLTFNRLTLPDSIAKMIKDYYEGDTSLNKLAIEINTALNADTGSGIPNYITLMEKLQTVSTEIKSLSTGGDEAIKRNLNEIARETLDTNFDQKKTPLLDKLKFFDNAIEEIKQIGVTPDETDQTDNVEINTTLPVDLKVLSNFPTPVGEFDRNFFNLAHLVISVINTVNTNEEGLTIKSSNSKEIERLVQKINALINLFYKSDKPEITRGNTGVFYNKADDFTKHVMNDTEKWKIEYLQISKTEQANIYSITNKDSNLTDEILTKIFKTLGSISNSIETPQEGIANTVVGLKNPISKQGIARNMHEFLNSNDILADIKIVIIL